jgi:hypothetical protein
MTPACTSRGDLGYARSVAAPLLPRLTLVIAAVLAPFAASTARAQEAAPAAPAESEAPPVASIDVPATPEKPPAESAPATPVPPPSPTISGKYLAVGSLALGAGVAFFVSALFDSFATSAHSDATTLAQQRACGAGPSCSAFDAKHDDASRDRTVSGVFAVVGAGVAVGAVAAWFFWPDDDDHAGKGEKNGDANRSSSARASSPSSPWLAPSVGPHGASLTAGVRF